MFEKNTTDEIGIISANLTNFFKAIVNFLKAVCDFFGFDPFAEEAEG